MTRKDLADLVRRADRERWAYVALTLPGAPASQGTSLTVLPGLVGTATGQHDGSRNTVRVQVAAVKRWLKRNPDLSAVPVRS